MSCKPAAPASARVMRRSLYCSDSTIPVAIRTRASNRIGSWRLTDPVRPDSSSSAKRYQSLDWNEPEPAVSTGPGMGEIFPCSLMSSLRRAIALLWHQFGGASASGTEDIVRSANLLDPSWSAVSLHLLIVVLIVLSMFRLSQFPF